MRKLRRGHIINITSMAGYIGLPGIAYYTASKFALEGISDVLAKELAPRWCVRRATVALGIATGGRTLRRCCSCTTRAALYSLIHSGLFQAASAFRKMFNLKGRNFRFE